MAHGKARVLFICTANVARSAAMELVLREALGPETSVAISSAGTRAIEGSPVHAYMQQELARRGISSEGFMAHRLQTDLLERADLIITASRRHGAAAARLVPGARRRMFTLLQLQRLLAELPDAEPPAGSANAAAALAALASPVRGQSTRSLARDDISDPVGGGHRAFRAALNAIVPAAQALAQALSRAESRLDEQRANHHFEIAPDPELPDPGGLDAETLDTEDLDTADLEAEILEPAISPTAKAS